MKKIIIALIALIPFFSFGQSDDTTQYTYYRFSYGNRNDRLWANKVLRTPLDTIYSKTGLAVLNGILYVGNGVKWSQVVGAAFDSLTVQGGGWHTQSYYDQRYRQILDTAYAHLLQTRARGQQIADSLGAIMAGKVANFLGTSFLGYGSHAARPTIGTGIYYDTDSTAFFYYNAGTGTNLTASYNLYMRGKGGPGDTTLVTASGNSLYIAAQRDSAGSCIHHVINPDGSWTWYTTCGTGLGTNNVTNSNLAQMPANTLKGNNTGSTANAADLTVAQVNALIGNDTSRATIGGLLAQKQINYGGAPGQLQGTFAGIPAATGYPTGTTYIAQDSGFHYVDTGSGGTRGWKQIKGGVSGGGGSQTLPQVLSTGRTIITNDSIIIPSPDTLYFKGGRTKIDTVLIGQPVYENIPASDTVVNIGTSITFGTGPTSNWYRYTTAGMRVLAPYGFFELNLGVSGSTAATQIGNIPVKRPGMRWLGVEFGSNELNAALDSASYRVSIKKFIDTAIARGWLPSQISIMSQMGTQLGVVGTVAQQRGYNYVDSTLALQYGLTYIDAYNPELLPQYAYAYGTPQLHPNNDQSYLLANIYAGALSNKLQFKKQTTTLLVKDTTQVGQLIYKNQKYVPAGYILGSDSVGNVGRITQLPAETSTAGRFYFNGAIVQRGFPLAQTYDTTKDFVLAPNMHIREGLPADPNNVYSDWQPFNSASGDTYFHNSFEGGHFYFYRSNGTRGAKVEAFQIPPTGALVMSPGATMAVGSSMSTVAGSGTGSYTPLTGGGNTEYRNSYPTGSHDYYGSNGTGNTFTKVFSILANGHAVGQLGGTFTDILQARLQLNSTTEGIMIPRMTTTQRNAIAVGQLTAGSITAAGTGYTSGGYTAVALTGGSGSGAIANANVSSGGVSLVTITTAGSGYKIGDVLSASAASLGGTGSGFQYTVTATLTDGLIIYNVETHKTNWFDGSVWRTNLDSARGAAGSLYTLQQIITNERPGGGGLAQLTKTDTISGQNLYNLKIDSFANVTIRGSNVTLASTNNTSTFTAGTNAVSLSGGFSVQSISLNSSTTLNYANAPTYYVDLATPGAAAVLTLPSAGSSLQSSWRISNLSTSTTNLWTFAGAGLLDAFGNTVTSFPIGYVYEIFSDGSFWRIKNIANIKGIPIAGSYSNTGTATTTFTVTIGITEPTTTYKVNVTPTDALGAALFYVNNKTATTFDVVYLSGLTGTVSFDWVINP